MAEKTYTRIAFPPAEVCYSAVRVFDGAGNLIRTIPAAKLRQIAEANERAIQAASIEPRRAHFVIPTVARRRKPKVEKD